MWNLKEQFQTAFFTSIRRTESSFSKNAAMTLNEGSMSREQARQAARRNFVGILQICSEFWTERQKCQIKFSTSQQQQGQGESVARPSQGTDFSLKRQGPSQNSTRLHFGTD